MPKPGTEYQELVALVAKALDPGAEVNVGAWVEGPDGEREVDVEVRGTADGRPHFVHIECKDSKRPVDIQAIDNLDSKRRDLAADAAMLYSNSGFTKNALRKAERVGIDALSAIAAGNRLVRPMIERALVAKRLSVDKYQLTLYPSKESEAAFPETWDYKTLEYCGAPFANWLSQRSTELLQRHEGEKRIVELAAFRVETPFTLEGVEIRLRGFRADYECSRSWVSQTVREDVSLGQYNYITRRITVPNKQMWSLGWIDREGWEKLELEGEPEEWSSELEPGTFRLNLTLINPVPPIEGQERPAVDELIGERRVDLG